MSILRAIVRVMISQMTETLQRDPLDLDLDGSIILELYVERGQLSVRETTS